MVLGTTEILNLLGQGSGRYIEHSIGRYRMKEANGNDVTIAKNGQEFFVEPSNKQMDGLMDESRIVRSGSIYRIKP